MYFYAAFLSRVRTRHFLVWNGSVLIGAGIWYQTNPVPDLRDTFTRNWRRKNNGLDLLHQFLERVSWVYGWQR